MFKNRKHKVKSNIKRSKTLKEMYRTGNRNPNMGQKPHKDEETRRRARLSAQMKNRYGITIDEFEKIKEKQKSKCAICKREIIRLCIDHNHKTSIVRGLLCQNCNTILGLCKENFRVLLMAIKYLKKYSKKKV